MAVKYEIDSLVEVPGNLRGEYVKAENGKFRLVLDGLPPESEKLAEFRTNNLALMRERDELKAKYGDIDIEAAKAALANQGHVNETAIGALKQRLTEAETAAKGAIEARDALILRQRITAVCRAAGVRPEAEDYMFELARKKFELVGDEIAPKDAAVPTVEDWVKEQTLTAHFAFLPSSGGGAPGNGKPPAKLGDRSDVKQLINPTPQELGAHSKDIASGKVKVAYTT